MFITSFLVFSALYGFRQRTKATFLSPILIGLVVFCKLGFDRASLAFLSRAHSNDWKPTSWRLDLSQAQLRTLCELSHRLSSGDRSIPTIGVCWVPPSLFTRPS